MKWKLINLSKINFIYIVNSGNKIDIDYKDNAKVSKIRFSSWVVQELFHIFGPRYLGALKLQLTVFTDPNWKLVFVTISDFKHL